jgi:hypothetical protein
VALALVPFRAMQRIAHNAGRALRLDRNLYTSLQWDHSATADAVLIVAIMGAFPAVVGAVLGRISLLALPTAVFQQVVGYLVGWLVAAGILHLVATRTFGSSGRWQVGLALAGYAYVPFVVVSAIGPFVANPFDGVLTPIELLLRLVGIVWFAAGLNRVADVAYDLPAQRSPMAAGLAVLGWWVVVSILL